MSIEIKFAFPVDFFYNKTRKTLRNLQMFMICTNNVVKILNQNAHKKS